MSPDQLLIVRWFEEVWNQGRRESIDAMLHPEGVIHDGPTLCKGPEGFKPFFDRMRAAFSDIRVTVHEVVSAGDLSSVRWSATMRHATDDLAPATGNEIRITGISM